MPSLLLLFLLLLFAPFARSDFGSIVDCNNNRCFAIIQCGDRSEHVFSYPHPSCPETHLLVEIDTRSALRFDFRVVYFHNYTELNLPEIVTITGMGATLTMYEGYQISLNITDRATASRQGMVDKGELSSYRFSIIVDPPTNLFAIFTANKFCKYKIADEKRKYFDCRSIYESFRKTVRCDPSYVVNQCVSNGGNCSMLEVTNQTATCSDRLWKYNAWDDTWLRVEHLKCNWGMWEINRVGDTSKWYVATNTTKLACAERKDVCDDSSSHYLGPRRRPKGVDAKVTMFLLGLYGIFTSIILIVLFVRLYRKMDGMRGPGRQKIMRPEDNPRAAPPPSSGPSSSGSSSESGSKKKEKKENRDKAVRAALKVAKKQKKDDKKVKPPVMSASRTDLKGAKTG